MARPRKAEAEKRDVVLGVRLTMTERAELDERAGLYGLSAAEFMRNRSLGFRLPVSVVTQRATAAVGSALSRACVNLNQIARRMNEGEGAPLELLVLIARLNAELDRIYDPATRDDSEPSP